MPCRKPICFQAPPARREPVCYRRPGDHSRTSPHPWSLPLPKSEQRGGGCGECPSPSSHWGTGSLVLSGQISPSSVFPDTHTQMPSHTQHLGLGCPSAREGKPHSWGRCPGQRLVSSQCLQGARAERVLPAVERGRGSSSSVRRDRPQSTAQPFRRCPGGLLGKGPSGTGGCLVAGAARTRVWHSHGEFLLRKSIHT